MTVGIADDFEIGWEGSRTAPASDLASVGSFVSWMLVEVLGRCAPGVDRKQMVYSRVPYHADHIATGAEDICCIAIAEEHMYQSVEVRRSCCSSSLLHLGHLALPKVA